jgi:hypothetical protein
LLRLPPDAAVKLPAGATGPPLEFGGTPHAVQCACALWPCQFPAHCTQPVRGARGLVQGCSASLDRATPHGPGPCGECPHGTGPCKMRPQISHLAHTLVRSLWGTTHRRPYIPGQTSCNGPPMACWGCLVPGAGQCPRHHTTHFVDGLIPARHRICAPADRQKRSLIGRNHLRGVLRGTRYHPCSCNSELTTASGSQGWGWPDSTNGVAVGTSRSAAHSLHTRPAVHLHQVGLRVAHA